MKKKLLSTLLVLALVLALLPAGAQAYGIYEPEIDDDDAWMFGDEYPGWWGDGWWDSDYPYWGYEDVYSIGYEYDSWEGTVYGPSSAEYGEPVSFYVRPEDGYKVSEIYLSNGSGGYHDLGTGTSFTMPRCNVTVVVLFARDDVEDNGKYSLGGDVYPYNGGYIRFYNKDGQAIASANEGETVTVSVYAAKDYTIESVYSYELGSFFQASSYWNDRTSFSTNFTMPDESVNFYVEFASDGDYDITVKGVTGYGSVDIDDGLTSADEGDIVSFTIEPYYDYIVDDVSVTTDGWSTVTLYRDEDDWNSYYFYMPDSDVEIYVSFTDDYHEITMDVGRNGKAVPEAQPSGYFSYVYYGIDGDRIYINATPDKGYKVSKITATDESGRKVSVYEAVKENQYYFTMPESDVTINVEFSYRVLTNPFTDVKTGDWFYNAVSYVYTEGLMTGTDTYTFSPNASTSRGMLVTILWRLQGEPYVSGSSFSDVKSSAYYYDAVRWAARYGIVEGYEGNVFKPDDAITREQFAAILYRYAQYCKYSTSASTNLSAYKDNAKVSSWAGTAMKWAVAEGLFEGDNLGNLDPQGQTTRAAAAKLLMAFCENVVD